MKPSKSAKPAKTVAPITPAELAALDDDGVPMYLAIADICRVSEKSPHTVREHLKKLGIGEEIGGAYWVSKYQLQRRWPSLHEGLLVAAERGRALRPERPTPTPPAPRAAM